MPSYVAIKAIMPLMSQFLNTNKLQRLSFRSKQIISLFRVVVVFFKRDQWKEASFSSLPLYENEK